MSKINKSENIFYGKRELLALSHATSGSIKSYLESAYLSCKTAAEMVLFHILCINMGEIQNRQHNIFGKKEMPQGGQSLNSQWLEYLNFMLDRDVKTFCKLLPIYVEYVGLREFTRYQISTKKKTSKIQGNWGLLAKIMSKEEAYKALLDLLSNYINSKNPFQRTLVAKFVSKPNTSKRISIYKDGVRGTRDLQTPTTQKMKLYHKLLMDISKREGFKVEIHDKNTRFIGFIEWRKEYNADLEYVLFSNGKIHDFDEEQFLKWIGKLPNGARNRVKRRLFDWEGKVVTKYAKLAGYFTFWETIKAQKQAETRELELKKANEGLTEAEEVKLKQVKKEGKVNTAGSTIFDFIYDLGRVDRTKNVLSEIEMQAIVDFVKFEVPVMVIVDCSGSMGMNGGFPERFAKLATSLVLYKNPDNQNNIFFRFGDVTEAISPMSTIQTSNNRFMSRAAVKVEKLVDKSKSFLENYNVISQYVNSNMGSTNIQGLADCLINWVNSGDAVEANLRKETIQNFPVMLIISDGDKC